jgi:proteasome lid subunit RPN8/RPN11
MMEYFQPRPRTTYPNLPFISRPSLEREFSAFVSEQDGFAALIHQDVKESISREAVKALPNETIGLLAGRVLRDERGPYTLVLAAQGARPDEIDATPSHVHISANGHAQVRNRLEGSAYGLDVIGWYHSHPRFPARFSPVDVTEQSTWRDPNHIGIVISGIDHVDPFGVYRGPKATLLTNSVAIPPPPPPSARLQFFEYFKRSIVPTRVSHSETALAVPPVTKSRPAKAETRLGSIARVLPWVLTFGLLGMLPSLAWLNSRISRIERTLTNSGYDAGRTQLLTPTPLPALDEKNLSDPSISLSKPSFVDRPPTKAPVTTPLPPTKRDEKTRKKRNRSALDSSRANSNSGAKRYPATRPTPSHKPTRPSQAAFPTRNQSLYLGDTADRPAKP